MGGSGARAANRFDKAANFSSFGGSSAGGGGGARAVSMASRALVFFGGSGARAANKFESAANFSSFGASSTTASSLTAHSMSPATRPRARFCSADGLGSAGAAAAARFSSADSFCGPVTKKSSGRSGCC